jgi:hypothetical protein
LTIKYRKPAFKGVAKTSEAKCKKGRGVLLKRKKKGRDPTIGSTTTDTRGRYKIASAGAKGKYYAIVSKTTEVTEQGDTLVCQRDKSPTTRV